VQTLYETENLFCCLSAQPTIIPGTKRKLPRQRALGLEFGRVPGRIEVARAGLPTTHVFDSLLIICAIIGVISGILFLTTSHTIA